MTEQSKRLVLVAAPRPRTARGRRFLLTVLMLVRMIPVVLSLLGSRFTWPERLVLGWIGPRGTTSIVFGLLAFNVLSDRAETDALPTMVVVVLGSVLLRGIGAPAAVRAFARSQPRMGS